MNSESVVLKEDLYSGNIWAWYSAAFSETDIFLLPSSGTFPGPRSNLFLTARCLRSLYLKSCP